MRFLGEDITVLAGHGFDEKGPYLERQGVYFEATARTVLCWQV